MRMEHIITLNDTETTPGPSGVPVKTETRTEVYADKLSARRSEYYAANAAGVRADIVFAVMADEYNGETEVDWGGARYSVVRAYGAGKGRVELTCALR